VPYYLTATHAGAAQIGLELSMLPVAIGIAAPIAGGLVTGGTCDRFLTGGGLVITGLGPLVIAFRHDTAGLLAGVALAGLGLGAFSPANNAKVGPSQPPSEGVGPRPGRRDRGRTGRPRWAARGMTGASGILPATPSAVTAAVIGNGRALLLCLRSASCLNTPSPTQEQTGLARS
jgi:MFS family permease